MHVLYSRSNALRDAQGGRPAQAFVWVIHIACATLQAGWAREVHKLRRHQRHDQGLHVLWVVGHASQGRHQMRVRVCVHASGHFAVGQTIAGDRAFE